MLLENRDNGFGEDGIKLSRKRGKEDYTPKE